MVWCALSAIGEKRGEEEGESVGRLGVDGVSGVRDDGDPGSSPGQALEAVLGHLVSETDVP